MNRLPDPSWKSGPPEPKHRHSEHAIDPQPVMDIDGVGVDEVERLDTDAIVAVQEGFTCHRDGCDVSPQKRHVYSVANVSDRLWHAVQWATDYELHIFIAENTVIVDYDETPILGVSFSDDVPNSFGAATTPSDLRGADRDVLGYIHPTFTDKSDFGGVCYGREEPNPDVDAYRYDEL